VIGLKMTDGYLAYRHIRETSTLTLISKGKRTLEVENKSGQKENYFASSHASHQYSPRSTTKKIPDK